MMGNLAASRPVMVSGMSDPFWREETEGGMQGRTERDETEDPSGR